MGLVRGCPISAALWRPYWSVARFRERGAGQTFRLVPGVMVSAGVDTCAGGGPAAGLRDYRSGALSRGASVECHAFALGGRAAAAGGRLLVQEACATARPSRDVARSTIRTVLSAVAAVCRRDTIAWPSPGLVGSVRFRLGIVDAVRAHGAPSLAVSGRWTTWTSSSDRPRGGRRRAQPCDLTSTKVHSRCSNCSWS